MEPSTLKNTNDILDPWRINSEADVFNEQAKEHNVYLLINSMAAPRLQARAFELEPNAESFLLFGNTCFDSMMAHSPFLITTQGDSPFLAWVTEQEINGWGMVLFSKFPLSVVAEHWQSLLVVYHEDKNEESLFRFYDNRIFPKILAIEFSREQYRLMGPVSQILAQDNMSWVHFIQPDSCVPKPEEQPQKLPMGWFRVTAEHLTPFADKRTVIIARNLEAFFGKQYPGEVRAFRAQGEDFSKFLESGLEEAQQMGIQSVEDLHAFSFCRFFLGQGFHEPYIEKKEEQIGARRLTEFMHTYMKEKESSRV